MCRYNIYERGRQSNERLGGGRASNKTGFSGNGGEIRVQANSTIWARNYGHLFDLSRLPCSVGSVCADRDINLNMNDRAVIAVMCSTPLTKPYSWHETRTACFSKEDRFGKDSNFLKKVKYESILGKKITPDFPL